ncbi:MAG: hypothetical protein Hyperionvirus4_159, partial [Hyperionvirus sp.]
ACICMLGLCVFPRCLGCIILSLEHTFVYILIIETYEIRDDLCIDSPRKRIFVS